MFRMKFLAVLPVFVGACGTVVPVDTLDTFCAGVEPLIVAAAAAVAEGGDDASAAAADRLIRGIDAGCSGV